MNAAPAIFQKARPTQSEVMRLFRYDPATGHFSWIVSRRGRNLTGPAGYVEPKGGYRRIRINGKPYSAHRLSWLYTYGEWPDLLIDHIDGDTGNNRITNLRLATLQENQFNRKASRTSSTGRKGVSISRRTGRFQSQIKIGGVRKFLGYYDTIEEGASAYKAAAAPIHREFINV
jgi:hypothetical protein